ncbi:MAG TPA: hypothetical protein VGB15_10535, partial [Longimicrobium sp.]
MLLPVPLLLRYRRLLIVLLHAALIPVGYYAAFALRFDFALPPEHARAFWVTLPYVVAIRLAAFAVFGLYSGWMRHVGMSDLVALVKAIAVSTLLAVAVLFMTGTLHGMPRSVMALDAVTALLLFGGVRFAVRAFREERLTPWRTAPGKRTVIIGAGIAGERLLRELQRDGAAGMCPLALLDDDPEKARMRIHGIPVLGTIADVGSVAAKVQAQLLV